MRRKKKKSKGHTGKGRSVHRYGETEVMTPLPTTHPVTWYDHLGLWLKVHGYITIKKKGDKQ